MTEREKLESFLIDLITPQNDEEKVLWKENNCVDDYIEITNRMPNMTMQELKNEINHQLSAYGIELEHEH